MREFVMSLVDDSLRPIVKLHNWKGFHALLDTGAIFPIWTADESMLDSLGGKCVSKGVSFSGFGGKTVGNLYKLKADISGAVCK